MITPDTRTMSAAIEIAEKSQTPFGAVLAMGDEIFATAANQTGELHDPTAHAELLVIRKLCRQLKKTDLSGFTLYSTCEPCPMCMSAAIWAKIDVVYYGCDIPSISEKMDQIDLRSRDIIKKSFHNVTIHGGVLEKRCLELLQHFS